MNLLKAILDKWSKMDKLDKSTGLQLGVYMTKKEVEEAIRLLKGKKPK